MSDYSRVQYIPGGMSLRASGWTVTIDAPHYSGLVGLPRATRAEAEKDLERMRQGAVAP